MSEPTPSDEHAAVDNVCICHHAANEHPGLIVPIEDEATAYYVRLLGACASCSCTVFDPYQSSHPAGIMSVHQDRQTAREEV